jgi:alcohol dehydrogenase (NADP+)
MPEVNQVELHPYLQQNGLKEFCDQNDILLTGYGPLGAAYRVEKKEVDFPILLEDDIILEISKKHLASPAQVVLAWGMERNTAVIPKSVNPDRIHENYNAYKLNLDKEDMKRIQQLEGPYRYTPGFAWTIPGSPYSYSDLWEEFD